MNVPETSLNCEACACPAGIDDVGIHDARMFTPGAATSGLITFPVCADGPRDEK